MTHETIEAAILDAVTARDRAIREAAEEWLRVRRAGSTRAAEQDAERRLERAVEDR